MTVLPFLLKGAKFDLKLNKPDFDTILSSNPMMAPMKDVPLKMLIQNFKPMIDPMLHKLKTTTPLFNTSLELMYDYFLADY